MVTRVGGLASGMDIDELVKKLMSAEKAPLNKLYQKKQTYEWQRDAYRGVNTKLKALDTYIADNLILKGFNTKTAATSNSAYVNAVATSSASGTVSIEGVSQLATAARTVGVQANSNAGVAKGSTKISDLENSPFSGSGDHSILLKAIKADGTMATEATEIKFTASDTIDSVLNKINTSTAGVTAFFENGKLSITAKNTGSLKDGSAEVQLVDEQTKNGVTVNATSGNKLFSALGVTSTNNNLVDGGSNAIFRVNGIDTERASNTFSMSGYSITLKDKFNANATLQNRVDSLNELISVTNTAISNLEGITDSNGTLQADVNGTRSAYESPLTVFNGAHNTTLSTGGKHLLALMNSEQFTSFKNIADLSDETEINTSGLTDTQKQLLKSLSTEDKSILETAMDEELNDLKKFSAYESMSVNSKILIDSMDEAGLQALTSITDLTDDALIDQSALTEEQKIVLKSFTPEQRTVLGNLSHGDLEGIKEVVNTKNSYDEKNNELTTAQNHLTTAKANLKDYTQQLQEANNELLKTPVDATAGQIVSLTSTTNVDDMMSKIKDYVNTYNTLIKDLNGQSTEKKYRDYTPLTDEQKEDMSENEIKLWEEKAKSGLLRSDATIRSGLTAMRGIVYDTNYAVQNTKFNTLYSVGITSSKNYNEGGTLEIDETKLRAALEEDPDAVTALFINNGNAKEKMTINGVEKEVDTRGYLQKIRSSMTTIQHKIEEKAGRSTMTDNQYSIGKNLVDTDKRIDSWKAKLEMIENRYWKQFTAMETAISNANSQSSYLSQFGGQS